MTSGLVDSYTYVIINAKTHEVIDMSEDRKIRCYPRNNPDSDNQKWTLQKSGSGTSESCFLSNLMYPNYHLAVGVQTCYATGPGSVIVPALERMSWNIYNYNMVFWRIFYPAASPGLNLDLRNHGSDRIIQLWESWDSDDPFNNGDHQKWIFECVPYSAECFDTTTVGPSSSLPPTITNSSPLFTTPRPTIAYTHPPFSPPSNLCQSSTPTPTPTPS